MAAGGAGQCLCVRKKGEEGHQFAVFQENSSALAVPVMTAQLPPVPTIHLPQADGSGYRTQVLKSKVLPPSVFILSSVPKGLASPVNQ